MSIQATPEMIAAFNEAFRAVRNDSVTYEDALKLGIEAALSAVPQPVDELEIWHCPVCRIEKAISGDCDLCAMPMRKGEMVPLTDTTSASQIKALQQDYIDLHNKHEALKAEMGARTAPAECIAIGSLSREAGSERIVLDPIGDPHIKDGMIVYTAPGALMAEVERLKADLGVANEQLRQVSVQPFINSKLAKRIDEFLATQEQQP
jgi:hypothetical protein